MSSSSEAIEALNAAITNALILIDKLQTVVSQVTSQGSVENGRLDGRTTQQLSADSSSLDALTVAHDSASLIKAHATKISLLIINEPFTPTAITKVLQDLVAAPLPSLAAAVELCSPSQYTQAIQYDLAWRAGRVFKELSVLISQIPRDGKILPDAKKNAPPGAAEGRGSIATTGILWSACEDVIAFGKRGFSGILVKKVEELSETLKDVMEELKEWGEEAEEDNDDDNDGLADSDVEEGDDEKDNSASNMQALLDDLMNSHSRIPRDDPHKIRERLEACLKKLRLTTLLYQATIKRRLKPLPRTPPTGSDIPVRLDEVLVLLKRIPEKFGNLAMAFYELDPVEIDRQMDECFLDAFAVSELLLKPWDKEKDEFTDWALRFQVEIKKS